MRISTSASRMWCVCAAVSIVVGCSSSGSQLAPAVSPYQQGSAAVVRGANGVAPDGIIYTPANIKIQSSQYGLDLDNDGMPDFIISEHNWGSSCFPRSYGELRAQPLSTAGLETDFGGYALALDSGSVISQSAYFRNRKSLIQEVGEFWFYNQHRCIIGSAGDWLTPKVRLRTAYLGLAFPIRGTTHYGWARLSVMMCSSGCRWLTATLTGYAYQTRAGVPIGAGKM
jgi:hypothetical protein